MLKRIRQTLTLLSFCLLIGLLCLWAGDRVLIAAGGRYVDARSYLLVQGGGLHLDWTGAYYILRDVRSAHSLSLAIGDVDDLPKEFRTAIADSGPLTFRSQDRFVRRAPLQDLTDSAGQPIMMSQSVPLRRLTVPAWLVAALLAIAPTLAAVRLIRSPRSAWLAPLRFARQRAVALGTLASILICLAWVASNLRPAMCYQSPGGSRGSVVARSSRGGLALMTDFPNEYRWRDGYVGNAGVEFVRPQISNGRVIAPIEHIVAARPETQYTAERSTQLPYWTMFVITAVLPMTWLAMRIWGRRTQVGHCSNCNYDLRHSTDRCPECGRSINSAEPPITLQRAQAGRFALAAILLLLAGTLTTAWIESRVNSGEGALFVIRRPVTWHSIVIEQGKLQLRRYDRPPGSFIGVPLVTMPAWLPIAGLLAVAIALAWSARGLGVVDSSTT